MKIHKIIFETLLKDVDVEVKTLVVLLAKLFDSSDYELRIKEVNKTYVRIDFKTRKNSFKPFSVQFTKDGFTYNILNTNTKIIETIAYKRLLEIADIVPKLEKVNNYIQEYIFI